MRRREEMPLSRFGRMGMDTKATSSHADIVTRRIQERLSFQLKVSSIPFSYMNMVRFQLCINNKMQDRLFCRKSYNACRFDKMFDHGPILWNSWSVMERDKQRRSGQTPPHESHFVIS
mmetsp:Transcript_32023/g.73579  ORF Transcript_32023/g.73579 Transcript_32023/m.73579 type:complete len:118 (+) Transcript_32023:657-1010(+)